MLWLHGPGDPPRPDVETAGALWTVATKTDLGSATDADHRVSALTGRGLDALIAALADFAAESLVGGEGAVITRLRHRAGLLAARDVLARSVPDRGDLELVAEDLRSAAAALDGLVGRIGTEEVLGTIFARFCIGK